MVEPKPKVKYPRATGAQTRTRRITRSTPGPGNRQLRAPKGILAGKKIAVKDNVCVAGLPLMNGSRVLENYVPEVDATVVPRILDAGGTIVGKTVCEDLCFSGGSHTSKPAASQEPAQADPFCRRIIERQCGRHFHGEVDAALGGDQGGSIRMPACWTGVYGLKATHGLVPYTGVMPIEPTLDHCGPMGATVEDVARLLTAIAGPDGRDPRQIDCKVQDYMGALARRAKGLKIAVVKEGFDRARQPARSRPKGEGALLSTFEQLGATVEEVSIPMHIAGL